MRNLIKNVKTKFKTGDTLIEVALAIAVFSVISLITLRLIDTDLSILQGTLETEMARNEIDAQAEALRYIHNAYLSERELASSDREYQKLWQKLSRGNAYAGVEAMNSSVVNEAADVSKFSAVECKKYYSTQKPAEVHSLFADKAFIINTRHIDPTNVKGTIIQSTGVDANPDVFKEATLYPRIVYTNNGGSQPSTVNIDPEALSEIYPDGSSDPTLAVQQNKALFDRVARAEGIWVIAVKQQTAANKQPEFYDFHIRTCWYKPGQNRSSTIGTTIRLYNPEYIEAQR
jgi:type II secretory pathway pseudopilin PulG